MTVFLTVPCLGGGGGTAEKLWPVDRVLGVRGVQGMFGPNAVGRGITLSNISLALRRNRFIAIVNKGNTKGSAALGTMTNM